MGRREPNDPAESLFARFLSQVEAGEELDFDAWVGEHAAHEQELRELHADWVALQSPSAVAGIMTASFFFHDGERERPEPAPGLEPGKVVGDFRLIGLIGQGGMGQVWEAAQTSLGNRRVAIKFVRPDRVTPRQLELFQREARAGGRLAHPGIVSVFGYGESDGLAWIAMELVEGCWTLRDFLDAMIRQDELPPDYDRHVASFIAETAEALQTAHDAGVIHRDLKPQNILITPSDRPKVTDFGLARITDESALSKTGDFAGTYFYMSPEQVAARRAGIDHRTDVFSLGVVLYEMLTLRRPFEGDTTHQIAAQVLTKEPPDPRTYRSRVPRDLAVIASKAMEKDPDRRYPTVRELADDLRRHLANESIVARPPSPLDRGIRWVQRHKLLSIAAALLIAIAVLVPITLVSRAETNRAEQRRAELQEITSPSSADARGAALLAIGKRILAAQGDTHDEYVYLTSCVARELLGRKTHLGRAFALTLQFAPREPWTIPPGLGICADVELRSDTATLSDSAMNRAPTTGTITRKRVYGRGLLFEAPYGEHQITAIYRCQLARVDENDEVIERIGSVVELPELAWSGHVVPPSLAFPPAIPVSSTGLEGEETAFGASVDVDEAGRRNLRVTIPALPFRMPFTLSLEGSGAELDEAYVEFRWIAGSEAAASSLRVRIPFDLQWSASGLRLADPGENGTISTIQILGPINGQRERLEIVIPLSDLHSEDATVVLESEGSYFFDSDDTPYIHLSDRLQP